MEQTYFCVHGHFYQPPREDPQLDAIPTEDGAAPYPNWNERIYHECYLPNTVQANFERISFNIGPTLINWLSRSHADTLRAIIQQENRVYRRTGLSNAIAQPYFHAILPLLRRREKETLVRWGIDHYTRHFGHAPHGMWLPETAVDLESLDVLAESGIRFTILAPWQAQDPSLDITQPYRVALPGGKDIIVFFYNSFLSSEISFNTSATMDADAFIEDWLAPQARAMRRGHPRLLMGASDGELYGHHMPEREQFLHYLMTSALAQHGYTPAFPAQWLRDFPPAQTARINENTSWSCHHGIERWRDVCGDAPHAYWKKPLRIFLDQLGRALDKAFEQQANGLVRDPWLLRDAYGAVLAGEAKVDDLINAHASSALSSEDRERLSHLLAMQAERLRMHSSDAWFFFDFDSLEPLNALKYAAHAVQLLMHAGGEDISRPLLPILAPAVSEKTGLTGDQAFRDILRA